MTSVAPLLPATRALPRLSIWLRAALSTLIATCMAAPAVTAAPEPRISGPHVHENLAIYLIHGESASGPDPLTLQEAMARDAVRVIETEKVNQLEIENTGTEDVFVQAGDIVKGGKQDRVLTVSLLLTPGAGKVPIGAFCVEQGRWAARGKEDVKRFASAASAMPSREAKLAMLAPVKPVADPAEGRPQAGAGAVGGLPANGIIAQRPSSLSGDDTANRQREVWAKVKTTQDKLTGTLGAAVASPQSRSSLQLSLENADLKKAQQTYAAALRPVADKEKDVIGFAVAINGKLASADVYPSNGLFRKMWSKQLDAGITEAIGEASSHTPAAGGTAERKPAPAIDAVKAFLVAAEQGKTSERAIARTKLETRDADGALLVQASRADGRLLHRNYLAK